MVLKCFSKMKEKIDYIHTPRESEVKDALEKQAIIVRKFHLDPNITIEDRTRELEETMAPLKHSPTTVKYSLESLRKVSEATNNKRLKVLYGYEFNHAREMEQVLMEMGVTVNPEFDVYYCPTVKDNKSGPGEAIGLLDMKDSILNLTREQTLEFDTKLAIKMFKSGYNSLEDYYTVLGILGANVIGKIRKVRV